MKATADIKGKITTLKKIQDEMKALKKREESLKEKLKEYMGDSDVLEDKNGNVLVTWKENLKMVFDTKTFKQVKKELYDKYLLAKVEKRFLVK